MFPVDSKTARPLTKNGLLDASSDPEVVATWFSGPFREARIGVAAGPSGVVIADLDRKNSKDGFESVDEAWLELPDSWSYPTPNGGEHRWFAAPEGVRLTGNADYRGLSGFDRRGGNSYVVLHTDELPESRDAFTPAPPWLLDEASARVETGFSGTITDWLTEFGGGQPNERMNAAISRIPTDDITHSAMVSQQYEFIRLGAEGSEGGAIALAALRRAWLSRDPALHSTPQEDWDFKFDEALESGIAKYGQELETIAALPEYLPTLELLPPGFDLSILMGAQTTKAGWFAALEKLVGQLDRSAVASLLWHAPATRKWSRDWSIEYVFEQIDKASAKQTTEPIENPVPQNDSSAFSRTALLTEQERESLRSYTSFLDRYVAWVESRTVRHNAPYTRASAWTFLSLAMGMYGFMAEDEGTLGVNLFVIVLGESGTGKTRSLKLRDTLLDQFFLGDPTYDLGGNPSPEGLHERLLKRDNKASHFNTDEADSALSQWLDRKYLAGLVGMLTNWFEGKVGAQLRRGQKEEDRQTATVSFNVSLWGTPDAVVQLLDEKLFKTGFLPRPVWFIGEPKLETDDRFKVSRGDLHRAEADFDPTARAWAVEMYSIRRAMGERRPMVEPDDVVARLEAAKKAMHVALVKSPRWSILEPSVTRLGDSIRKAAALLALARGDRVVRMPDMLAAIEQGEEWMRNVVWVADQVSASDFSRDCDAVEAWVLSHGGDVSLSALTHAFRKWELRDFGSRLESLIAQGRCARSANGLRVVINQEYGKKEG